MKKLLLAVAVLFTLGTSAMLTAAPAAAAYGSSQVVSQSAEVGTTVAYYNLGVSCKGCGVDLDPPWVRHDNANDNYAGWYCGGNGWSCWYYDLPAFLLHDNDNYPQYAATWFDYAFGGVAVVAGGFVACYLVGWCV